MTDTKTMTTVKSFARYLSCLAAAWIFMQPSLLKAEEVWLNPGYINGVVNVQGTEIDYAYLTAVSGDFRATSYSTTGEYTLTVNTPVNGGYYYETSGFIFADTRHDYLHFPHASVLVKDNETTQLHFNIKPGYIRGSFLVEEGCSISGGRVYASADGSASTVGYSRDSVLWVGSRTIVEPEGDFYFPVVSGDNITLASYVTRSNGEHINLATKTVTIEPGVVTDVTWDVGCTAGVTSSIYGSIGITGIDNFTSHSVKAKKAGTGAYIDAEIFCDGNDCTYQFADITPGTWHIYPAITELNGDDDEFRYPRGSYDYEVTVEAGQSVRDDIVVSAAFMNGNVSLKGVKNIQDTAWAEIAAYGKYNTPSYAGWSYDFINPLNGDFDLVVSEGEWKNYYSRFYFFNNDQSDYLRSYLYVYDYSRPFTPMNAGDTVDSGSLEYQTGSVTVRYTVDNDGVLSFPSLRGNTTTENGIYSYVYAFGEANQTKEGFVSFIGIPGSYKLTAEAYVGGSRTTFGEVEIEVIYGGDRELDIGSPLLSVESPLPEEYTENLSVVVSGTTTDDDGVKDIVINGENSSFSATNNPNDGNEVYYSKEVALEPGPNKIEITVTDNLDKSITDSRSVYVDNEYPTISWEPVDVTSTVDATATVIGTATDDNTITVVTVNGNEVEFVSTDNPEDPNEVEFSTEVDLELGSNQIVVVASDNCKLSTSETHTITRIEPDTTAPVLTCPSNQTIDYGKTVSLGQPIVSDNTDPSPKVSNNAPSTFALGSSEITWSAADTWGNKSTCLQVVTIVDRTPPTITCPADTKMTQGEKLFLGVATAKDNVDTTVSISSDAPETFQTGTTTVNWNAKDSSGNTSNCQQQVTVLASEDTVGKFIVTPGTDILWPPNHKYAVIKVDITALSSAGKNMADQVRLVSVTSDEPEDLQERTRSFKNTEKKLKNRISKINKKISVLKKKLKNTNKKRTTLKGNIKKTYQKISDLKKKIRYTNKKISVLKKQKVNKKQRNELNKQQKELEKRSLAMKNQRKSIQNQRNRFKKSYQTYKNQRNSYGKLQKAFRNQKASLKKLYKRSASRGDGNTTNDMVIINDNTIKLRAERIGGGNGRVYTLNYTITDSTGNTTNASATVSVPKSPKKKVVNSGAKYQVTR